MINERHAHLIVNSLGGDFSCSTAGSCSDLVARRVFVSADLAAAAVVASVVEFGAVVVVGGSVTAAAVQHSVAASEPVASSAAAVAAAAAAGPCLQAIRQDHDFVVVAADA